MRHHNPGDPVYAPNSKGGPHADTARFGEPAGWHADGDMQHAAYTLHAEDDDWGQAGTLVRDVIDDAARDRLVHNIVGHLLNGVTEPVLLRAFEYWRNVDKTLGDRSRTASGPSRPRGPQGGGAGQPGSQLRPGQGLNLADADRLAAPVDDGDPVRIGPVTTSSVSTFECDFPFEARSRRIVSNTALA